MFLYYRARKPNVFQDASGTTMFRITYADQNHVGTGGEDADIKGSYEHDLDSNATSVEATSDSSPLELTSEVASSEAFSATGCQKHRPCLVNKNDLTDAIKRDQRTMQNIYDTLCEEQGGILGSFRDGDSVNLPALLDGLRKMCDESRLYKDKIIKIKDGVSGTEDTPLERSPTGEDTENLGYASLLWNRWNDLIARFVDTSTKYFKEFKTVEQCLKPPSPRIITCPYTGEKLLTQLTGEEMLAQLVIFEGAQRALYRYIHPQSDMEARGEPGAEASSSLGVSGARVVPTPAIDETRETEQEVRDSVETTGPVGIIAGPYACAGCRTCHKGKTTCRLPVGLSPVPVDEECEVHTDSHARDEEQGFEPEQNDVMAADSAIAQEGLVDIDNTATDVIEVKKHDRAVELDVAAIATENTTASPKLMNANTAEDEEVRPENLPTAQEEATTKDSNLPVSQRASKKRGRSSRSSTGSGYRPKGKRFILPQGN
ncbi:hypothetical protein DFH27DRAFT_601132 [Peziza echinospora]|nr:hypothetical protein DFH27DRAFT_601132 [Peziza echinospora]